MAGVELKTIQPYRWNVWVSDPLTVAKVKDAETYGESFEKINIKVMHSHSIQPHGIDPFIPNAT